MEDKLREDPSILRRRNNELEGDKTIMSTNPEIVDGSVDTRKREILQQIIPLYVGSSEDGFTLAKENHDTHQCDVNHQIPRIVFKEIKSPFSEGVTVDSFTSFVRRNQTLHYYLNNLLINLVAIVYFMFATSHHFRKREDVGLEWCNGYGFLLIIYSFVYGRFLYDYGISNILQYCSTKLCHCHKMSSKNHEKFKNLMESVICIATITGISIFLIIDTKQSRRRLIGLLGVIITMFLGWIFSKHPTQVNWKPVIWGLVTQFVLGIVSIRWPVGRSAFECLSDKVVAFLGFSKHGASFVFSSKLVEMNIFAFTVLPVLIFFSFTVKILFHWGIMQCITTRVGIILYSLLGTTVCESLHAATTLFLGMPESFLVIEPYLNQLTGSEIHAIMCSCFATTSGTVMAAYISFGAQPVHLITATLMSAPAGLCFAKLLYPETKKSSTTFDEIVLKNSDESSLLDVATKGALSAIPLILGVVANLIAFVSAVTFCDAVICWLGSLVGFEGLSFELILAKLFIPVSYAMGVPWDECEVVGVLIGLKTVTNEFIAYQKLGQLKQAGKIGGRAEAIATYAVCGFANPSSLGIMIASLSTLAPQKKADIINSVFRAFIGGCAVCFLTASIAGVLIHEDSSSS